MDTDKDSTIQVKNDSPEGSTVYRGGEAHDPEMEGLTLYEKKALLVNRELDSHGMGKYQWYIFFLCGFGYLIDLLYAQAFGLVEPAIQQEFGFGDKKSGDIFSSFSAGLTAGVRGLKMMQYRIATADYSSPPGFRLGRSSRFNWHVLLL